METTPVTINIPKLGGLLSSHQGKKVYMFSALGLFGYAAFSFVSFWQGFPAGTDPTLIIEAFLNSEQVATLSGILSAVMPALRAAFAKSQQASEKAQAAFQEKLAELDRLNNARDAKLDTILQMLQQKGQTDA